MKTIVKFITIVSILIFTSGSLNAGLRDPVAVLFQVKGNVEYSKNGKKWKKVRRNKFLFAGYKVRSSVNSSGKITVKTTGNNLVLGADTVLEVTANDLNIVSGKLEKAEQSSRLISGLVKKFSKSQSYTTVRRSVNSTKGLDAVRRVVVSEEHPYLVWDNLDKNVTYKLMIGDETYEVESGSGDVVRAKIEPFSGTREFKITAVKNDKVVADLKPYKSRGELKPHTVSWLEKSDKKELNKITTDLANEYGEDTFILGTYYEKVDMWVAAMDQYRKYLQDNPDDIEMTPYLFRVYKKLKLDSVYRKELNEWTQAMAN
jgi:hypothetical protein